MNAFASKKIEASSRILGRVPRGREDPPAHPGRTQVDHHNRRNTLDTPNVQSRRSAAAPRRKVSAAVQAARTCMRVVRCPATG